MKKLIALLLVLVTLCTVSLAAFTDQKDITKTYVTAVEAMAEAKIIGGFEDGSFRPKESLTRAQAAKIICTMLGAENETAAPAGFTDVPAGHWAEKFINYCAEKQIVAGIGSGKFDPNGQLKGSQWAKMLLVAYGHDAAELTGDSWFANTQQAVKNKGLDKDAHLSDTTTTREKACQLAYNFYEKYTFLKSLPEGYAEESIDMVKEETLYKSYGRMYAADAGLAINWPGSGVEFEAECAGDMFMTYTAEESGYFQIFVDGQTGLRVRTTTGKNRTVTVAEDLAPGKHNIRIIRDHDTSSKGLKFELTSVNFIGKKETVKAAADKKLLIEFVGDSITSGKGAIVEYLEKDQIYGEGCHSGTVSYAYLASQLLDADWTMLSRGSAGYFQTSTSCPKTVEGLYPYYNGLMKDPIPYTATRQADVAVLALCTNDSTSTMEKAVAAGTTSYKDMEGAVKWLMEAVRKNHGKDVKIVLLYGMMTSNNAWEPTFKAIADADPNVFALRTTRNNDGGRSKVTSVGHPSAAAHKVVAQELADFLKNEVLK